MRKVTLGVATSLDNFIARKNHAVDWLQSGKEAAPVMEKFWKGIDTIVMGRKTYEIAVKLGMVADPGVKNYVCSRTLNESTVEGVTIVPDDAARFVRKLKREPGKGICVMGGGVLAQSLLKADVVDEISLNIHPVLLGEGIPLFLPRTRQLDLKLLDCQTFKNGCVLVTYQVKHQAVKARAGKRGR